MAASALRAGRSRRIAAPAAKRLAPSAEVFIRQSWRSQYCGAYATAMFLSLLGQTTHRHQAKALFLSNRPTADYGGAYLEDISHVLDRSGAVRCVEWLYFDGLRMERVAKRIHGSVGTLRMPSILSFGIIHPVLKVRARHAAVVLSASAERIELLDSLAPPPVGSSVANTVVTAAQQVVGAGYQINARATVALLRWQPDRLLRTIARPWRGMRRFEALDQIRDQALAPPGSHAHEQKQVTIGRNLT
jgi:hypothetical protein